MTVEVATLGLVMAVGLLAIVVTLIVDSFKS